MSVMYYTKYINISVFFFLTELGDNIFLCVKRIEMIDTTVLSLTRRNCILLSLHLQDQFREIFFQLFFLHLLDRFGKPGPQH